MARNTRAKIIDNLDLGQCHFTFAGGGEFTAKLAELPESIVRTLAVSRLHNKLMDSYADPNVDPLDAVQTVYANLKTGVWSERGTGEGGVSILAQVLFDMAVEADAPDRPSSVEEMDDFLEAQTKQARKELRAMPAVAARIAEVESQRKAARAAELKAKAAESKFDLSAMFGGKKISVGEDADDE
jgi:hypothetical protein